MVSEITKSQSFEQRLTRLDRISPVGYPAKRTLDLLLSGLITVFLLSWMIPLIGLAIVVTSPGPPIFVQLRSGRNGRQFRCLKFRTMYTPPRGRNAFAPACRNDPRVTRLGRFLRRTNLDEMPQFLNVLVGDMSLVGPRPHPIELDAQYWFKLPHYPLRYGIRPGLTGLAQVSGCRGGISHPLMMKHRVRYDRFYIKNVSPFLDLYVCLLTLAAMFQGNTDAF